MRRRSDWKDFSPPPLVQTMCMVGREQVPRTRKNFLTFHSLTTTIWPSLPTYNHYLNKLTHSQPLLDQWSCHYYDHNFKEKQSLATAIYCSFQFILSGVHPIRFDSPVFCIIYAMPHQPVYQNPRSILFPIIIASNPIWTSPQSLFLVNKILCQITLFSISCIIMNRAVHICQIIPFHLDHYQPNPQSGLFFLL